MPSLVAPCTVSEGSGRLPAELVAHGFGLALKNSEGPGGHCFHFYGLSEDDDLGQVPHVLLELAGNAI